MISSILGSKEDSLAGLYNALRSAGSRGSATKHDALCCCGGEVGLTSLIELLLLGGAVTRTDTTDLAFEEDLDMLTRAWTTWASKDPVVVPRRE